MEIRATKRLPSKRLPPKRFPLSWFILRGMLLLVVLVGRLLYICDSNIKRTHAISYRTDDTLYDGETSEALREICENYRKMYRMSPRVAERFLMSLSPEERDIVMTAIESDNE